MAQHQAVMTIWKLGEFYKLRIFKFQLLHLSTFMHFLRNGQHVSSPLIGQYCGNKLPPRQIPSFTNALYLKFHSDSSKSMRGFEIYWDGTSTGTLICSHIFSKPLVFVAGILSF